jgi:hypothetical protein
MIFHENVRGWKSYEIIFGVPGHTIFCSSVSYCFFTFLRNWPFGLSWGCLTHLKKASLDIPLAVRQGYSIECMVASHVIVSSCESQQSLRIMWFVGEHVHHVPIQSRLYSIPAWQLGIGRVGAGWMECNFNSPCRALSLLDISNTHVANST